MKADRRELLCRIALTQVPLVGHIIAKNLISYCGSATSVFEQSQARLVKIPSVGKKIAEAIAACTDLSVAEAEADFMEKNGVKAIFYADKEYPQRLLQLPDAPLLLFTKGNLNLNPQRTIGIVGTRGPGTYGKEWTEHLVEHLAGSGCTVVSGLAYGIDAIAHKTAIKAGLPTLGVLGNGLKNIYPAQHKTLAAHMMESGGVITEYLHDTKPDAPNFPERNRIVAALSDALLVVETRKKGGSMITAELANQYNRDVFALPGRAGDELSEGCNFLIKNNKAALVESAADLLYMMGWNQEAKPVAPKLFPTLSEKEQPVFDALKGHQRVGIDELCHTLQLPQHLLSMILLELELKELVRSLPGKYYELR